MAHPKLTRAAVTTAAAAALVLPLAAPAAAADLEDPLKSADGTVSTLTEETAEELEGAVQQVRKTPAPTPTPTPAPSPTPKAVTEVTKTATETAKTVEDTAKKTVQPSSGGSDTGGDTGTDTTGGPKADVLPKNETRSAGGSPEPVAEPRSRQRAPRQGGSSAWASPDRMQERAERAAATPNLANTAGLRAGTGSVSATPFLNPVAAPPVVTAPFAFDLPQVAEELVAAELPMAATALQRSGTSATTTLPAQLVQGIPGWLLATAAGLLLLVGAAHGVHAYDQHWRSARR